MPPLLVLLVLLVLLLLLLLGGRRRGREARGRDHLPAPVDEVDPVYRIDIDALVLLLGLQLDL